MTTDLTGKTPEEVADIIQTWRQDDSQLCEAAFDLLNGIEEWLRGTNKKSTDNCQRK